MNFFEEFSKLNDKDKKEVLDIMKLKMNLENEELRKKIKKYEDPEDLTLMFMYCDLKAKDTIKELEQEVKELNESITWWQNRFNAVERDNRSLQEKIDKAIECIEEAKEFWITLKPDNSHIAIKHFNKFLEILRGE